MEWGSVAELFGAASSFLALLIAWQANKIAKSAQEAAVKAAEDARNFTTQRATAVMKRERRELAGQLQVWWVKKDDAWGFVLQNQGNSPCVFKDVSIRYSPGHFNDETVICTVPPGIYFLENKKSVQIENGKQKGSVLEPLVDLSTCKPISKSKDYTILAVEYTDSLNIRWRWTPETGLEEVS